MHTQLLKTRLAAYARELGFQECRIAPARKAAHAAAYRQWIADGCHGEMGYLARNPARREDPREVVPGARSVVVLAMNYFQGTGGDLEGRIARYAWGDDYHDLIEDRLRELHAWMEARGGSQRYYVDTGPVLERDFASEAGVGWNGKSTMQIHRNLGTWFFLAEIITTLDLPPDPAAADRCGKCTRCIDACPTDAITDTRRLDARRCLSYLTIENKGPIPVEFRRALGGRIFGCDECLDVCPWNRFAEASRECAFQARESVAAMRLRDFLALDDDGFRARFRKSPIKRAKRRGFLRNVCVALGNTGTGDDLPALETAAQDPEPLIAEHARWAIAEIGAPPRITPS